jgi:inner membrane protein
MLVVVDDEQRLGIYDPRFYDNGKSFLYEYMGK